MSETIRQTPTGMFLDSLHSTHINEITGSTFYSSTQREGHLDLPLSVCPSENFHFCDKDGNVGQPYPTDTINFLRFVKVIT